VPIVATLAARIDAPLFSHALAPRLPAAQIGGINATNREITIFGLGITTRKQATIPD
jgi:hypothetical protein